MISLIPICCVFLLTARLKCFVCGGGGPCPVNRGGTCDCIMSFFAILIIFFIFRATGVLDKIFYALGYAKAKPVIYTRYIPTPGDITECSREETTLFYITTTFFTTTTEASEYEDISDSGDDERRNMPRTTDRPLNWTTVFYYLV